ncbi:MAG TPA: CoA-transferase [Candidatus Dormibacteraeota bacterium]
MLMALQAGASGIGWTPVPGLLGTDLLRVRTDFRVVPDPFQPEREVVLVPALAPEFALLQGRRADAAGNVVIGTAFDDRLLAQASTTVIVCVEEVREGAADRLHGDEQVIPAAYVDILTVAPHEGTGRATLRYVESRDRATVQP